MPPIPTAQPPRATDATVTTRASLLTPPGRGALAVVGVAGPGTCELVDRLFRPRGGRPLAERPAGSITVGIWQSFPGTAGEELVVVRPAVDRLEIHCHGGTAAAEAVLGSLDAAGAVRQPWLEWLAAISSDAIAIEARQALAIAAGPRAARILGRQLAGALAAEFDRIAGLAATDRAEAVNRLLRAGRVGLRLVAPWQVVVAGPVNAGKSSLVNALAGHPRSIVSPEAGTTRDLVTTRLVLGGWEVDLIDTAGDRTDARNTSPTEHAGIARAAEAAAEADLILRLVPAGGQPPKPGPREIIVITKADLMPAGPFSEAAAVTSALTGLGVVELEARIVASLVPEDTAEPDLLAGPVPFTSRQMEELGRLLAS